MQPNILDLSPLTLPLQQELIDFYEFLLEKQAKNKPVAKTDAKMVHSSQSTKGFAMLKTNRSAVPADFDPASLLNHDNRKHLSALLHSGRSRRRSTKTARVSMTTD